MTTATDTLSTRIHCYLFDVTKPDESAAWAELQRKLMGDGLECFAAWDMGRSVLPDTGVVDVELETGHLFNNQWNTAPVPGVSDKGLRVFDWYRGIVPNEKLMIGHWIEQTDAMREARANRVTCGYCGRQRDRKGAPEFCDQCLDSEYLKPKDLPLLRLRGVSEGLRYRAPELTEAELADLVPRYVVAQRDGNTERGKARIARARKDVEDKYAAAKANAEAAKANAEVEYKGALWIMDHAPGLYGNAIFYNHTGRWEFGWRKPLSGVLLSALLDVVSEFPYPYDIKTADGRTLGADR